VPVLFHPAGGEFVALNDIDYGMRCTESVVQRATAMKGLR
jgi:hypothetical protein